MSPARFVWANLRRRPARVLLTLAAVTVAFLLQGLSLGIAEGFRRAAAAHDVVVQPAILAVAIGVSTIGMLLTLLLTTSATSHAIRARILELALLKALGFSHRRILGLLVAEAAVPCVAGAVVGLVGARLLFAGLVAALPVLAVIPAPAYVPSLVAMTIALSLIVASIGAAVPAARIARTDVAVLMGGSDAPAAAHGRDDVRNVARLGRDDVAEKTPGDEPGVAARVDLLLLRQIAVATRIGLSTLPMRLRGAVLIVISVGGIVFLMLTPLSGIEGSRVALLGSGDPSRVVLRSASTVLLDDSHVPEGVAALVADAPGIAHSADGRPLLQSEVFTWAGGLIKRNNDKAGYAMLVGVEPRWPQMTPQLRLLSGRLPRPGNHELIAGDLAAGKFSSLDAGTLQHEGAMWRIVGTFRTGGWWDGYLVGDAAEIEAAASGSPGSAVRGRLNSPHAFDTFRDVVAPRLPPGIVLERETDYYASLWRRIPKALLYVALVLAVLISAGAALGTTLVMDSALDDRRREIATLHLLGFDARAVAASVVLEGTCVAVGGALCGTMLAWLLFDGDLYNGAWNVFRRTVDLPLLALAVAWGIGIALAGTSVLALRTLRTSALDAIGDL